MDQRYIDLFDKFTHGTMSRRRFMERLAKLAGGQKSEKGKFDQLVEQGLTAYLADHLDDSLAAGDCVDQSLEDLAAATARIEQLGVRRDPERRTLEAEMVVIHRCRRRFGFGL